MLTGCIPVPFPDTVTYFEPSIIGGKRYNSYYCHEYRTKLEFNKNVILVESRYSYDSPYSVTFYFEPKEKKFKYKTKLITLKDTTSNKRYLPIAREIKSYGRLVNDGFLQNKAINTDRIILTYGIPSDSLADFQIIFPKGSIILNNKDFNFPIITFKRKSKKVLNDFVFNHCY